jgi:hypothetical protein
MFIGFFAAGTLHYTIFCANVLPLPVPLFKTKGAFSTPWLGGNLLIAAPELMEDFLIHPSGSRTLG